MQTENISETANSLMGNTVGLAFAGAVLLLWSLIWIRIYSKAGFHWAMGLLMLIPLVNAIMLLVLAFSKWPAQKELSSLRSMHKSVDRANESHYKRVA